MDFDITSLLNKSSESKDAKTNGKTTKKVSPVNFFKVNRKIHCVLPNENCYFDINNDLYFPWFFFQPAVLGQYYVCIVFSLVIFLYHLPSAHLFYSLHYWLFIASYWCHFKGLKPGIQFFIFGFFIFGLNIYSGFKSEISIKTQYFIFQVSGPKKFIFCFTLIGLLG